MSKSPVFEASVRHTRLKKMLQLARELQTNHTNALRQCRESERVDDAFLKEHEFQEQRLAIVNRVIEKIEVELLFLKLYLNSVY